MGFGAWFPAAADGRPCVIAPQTKPLQTKCWSYTVVFAVRDPTYFGHGCGACFNDCGEFQGQVTNTSCTPIPTTATISVPVGIFGLCPSTIGPITYPIADTGGGWVFLGGGFTSRGGGPTGYAWMSMRVVHGSTSCVLPPPGPLDVNVGGPTCPIWHGFFGSFDAPFGT